MRQVSLMQEESFKVIDVYRLPFGIRTITWNNSTILINGEPFYFRGLGRHEDTNVSDSLMILSESRSDADSWQVRGKGLDLVMVVKDHNLMRWLGANSYRTSHYPYSEESLELSDRYGIVVVAESPAVNLE